MRTKTILFFFLLLVVGAGNGFAENTSRDSLFQEIKNARTFAKNWDTIPGSDNDKVLAILTGKAIQVEDSIRDVKDRSFGVLLHKKVYYTRHIYYDETNKLFKQEIKFSQKKYNIKNCIRNWFNQVALLFILYFFTGYHRKHRTFSVWIAWCTLVGILIYLSYYIGSIFAIISLLHIIKGYIDDYNDYKLKKTIESLTKE